jgi:hypothetical protein
MMPRERDFDDFEMHQQDSITIFHCQTEFYNFLVYFLAEYQDTVAQNHIGRLQITPSFGFVRQRFACFAVRPEKGIINDVER